MTSYHLQDLPDVGSPLQGAFERTVPKGIPETSGMRQKSFQSLRLSKLYQSNNLIYFDTQTTTTG